MDLPQRKRLPHLAPDWVAGGALFFLTINCDRRGVNSLCLDHVAPVIFAAAEHYHATLRWHVRLLLLMPDHLHLLVSFPRAESMPAVVRAWKHYLAAKHGIVWQRDFFDHRLRGHEGLDEKAHYIRKIRCVPALSATPPNGSSSGRPTRGRAPLRARRD